MNNGGFEIERKYLIRIPDKTILDTCTDSSEIVQTYLASAEEGISERVRKRSYPDRTEYTHTVKRRITDIRREEHEDFVSAERYEKLLLRADRERRQIVKTRYCFKYLEHIFELDVFPFWTDRAFLEVELGSEDENAPLPPFVELIREISDDRRYTNSAIAREIPFEDI